MMFFLISWLLVPLLFLHTIISNAHSQPLPVCIIGGGVSGLTLANMLQFRGYNVELYEQYHRFGGKLDTYRKNGSLFEKGPIIFTDKDYFTLKWLSWFGMETIEYNQLDHALVFQDGIVHPVPPVESDKKIYDRIYALCQIYKREWNKYPPSTWDYGYSRTDFAKYPELAGPITLWLAERGLSELTPFFIWYMTIEGYGDLRVTPAIYALKLFKAENAEFFFEIGGLAKTVKNGFYLFGERLAGMVRKKFQGWEATKIERRWDGNQDVTFNIHPRNHFNITTSTFVTTCGRTIIAFPPLYPYMKELLQPMNSQEQMVFQAIKVTKYASVGADVPDLNIENRVYLFLQPKPYTVVPQFEYPPGDGSLMAIARQDKDGTATHIVGYSWIAGDYDHMADDADTDIMWYKMNDDIFNKFNLTPSFKHLTATDYFPHFPGETIIQKFYEYFDQIQGNGGVFYATTLLSMESINNAIEMTENFIERYACQRNDCRSEQHL